jgi:hypothetical protein
MYQPERSGFHTDQNTDCTEVNSKPGKLHRITHQNAQMKVQELENVIVEENPEGVYNTM